MKNRHLQQYFAITLLFTLLHLQIGLTQFVKKINNTIDLDPEKCESLVDGLGNFVMPHRVTLDTYQTNFAVTEDNVNDIFAGNVIFADPKMITENGPKPVPLKLNQTLIYSSIACGQTKSLRIVPNFEEVQNVLLDSLDHHLNTCRKYYNPSEITVQKIQAHSRAQVEVAFTSTGSEVPKSMLDQIDFEAIQEKLVSVSIEHFRRVFFRMHASRKPEVAAFFDASSEEVQKVLNGSDYAPAFIRSVSYGRHFYLVIERVIGVGNRTAKAYGRFYDHEWLPIKDARAPGKFRSLFSKMMRFRAENPGQPLSYEAEYLENKQGVSATVREEYVATVLKKPTIIEIANDRFDDTTWEITYDIMDVDEDCKLYKKVRDVVQTHKLVGWYPQEADKKEIRLDGNYQNIRLYARSNTATIFDVHLTAGQRHKVSVANGIRSENYRL